MAVKKKSRKSSRKAPWNRPAPAGSKHRKLSPRRKAAAKARAKRAGRSYPNLVDNMRAARPRKKKR